MKSIPFAFMIVFCVAIWEFGSTNPVAMSCDSCGSECARACGTRHFRSCCFNYVRKRSSVSHPYSLNKMRYDMLYRQFPYGNQGKISSKLDQEQKPHKEAPKSGSSHNEISDDVSLKNFYKLWKEGSTTVDEAVFGEDYEE